MKTALKITVSLFLFGAIVWMLGGPGEIGSQIRRINPLYIVPIAALTIIDRALMTYKWGLLLKGRGIRLPFLRGMLIYCASAIWGLFLPSTVGADAIRAYSTSRTMGIESREVVASIIVERFIGFLSALLLAILSLVLMTCMGSLGDWVLIAWLLGGGMLGGAILLFTASFNQRVNIYLYERVLRRFGHLRITGKIREFHQTYRSFFGDLPNLLRFFGLTFVEQLLPILDTWVIARGMGIQVGVLYFAGALPFALLISRLPISFDGIGVFEGMFVVLMSMAGLTAAQAVAIAIVGRVLQTLTLIPWWMVHVIRQRDIRPPIPVT